MKLQIANSELKIERFQLTKQESRQTYSYLHFSKDINQMTLLINNHLHIFTR
jgi:hypothetical protein